MFRSERGAVAIQLGLMMVVILGMVALGVEITFVLYKHRQMQSAADSAALGGAIALMRGYPSDFRVESQAIAAAAGFVNGTNDVTVTVNRPPTLGSHTGDTNAVEVIVSQPQYLALVSLFREGLFQVGARAVAAGSAGLFCILGLDPMASGTVNIKNNGLVSSPTCGVGVNSSSNKALIVENNAAIYGPVSVVGEYSLANNGHLYYQNPPYPQQDASPFTDPYASVVLNASGTARAQPTGCVTCQLLPGVYAQGLNYTSAVTLNFTPGVYYISTRLNLTNNVTVVADGVTIVINGNYTMNLGNNLNMTVTAPTSGATAGIAMASIRTASSSVTQKFSNNAYLNLTGALYFPNQTLQFDNNSTINTPTCGQLIARKISIQNNANLKTSCTGTGVTPVTAGGPTTLVE